MNCDLVLYFADGKHGNHSRKTELKLRVIPEYGLKSHFYIDQRAFITARHSQSGIPNYRTNQSYRVFRFKAPLFQPARWWLSYNQSELVIKRIAPQRFPDVLNLKSRMVEYERSISSHLNAQKMLLNIFDVCFFGEKKARNIENIFQEYL